MNKKLEHSHIGPNHLQRKAFVYIRQSSERQVQQNKESRILQYALQDKAQAYGWSDIEIIDEDLGISAATGGKWRNGFERMLNAVTQNEVGIIFSREVSRLSRTNRDWCQLFEVCGLFFTLIGDDDHIYDPNSMDDQLVLGIKATLSVVELKVLHMRLIDGMEEKARRGELKRLTPPGYIWDTMNKVVKDPDLRVQDGIMLVFTKFREIRSIRQTFLWFHNNGVELPVNKFHGRKRLLEWKLPSKSFVQAVLENACYAGAYVWGRRTTKKEYKEGRIIKRIGSILKPQQSRVLIKDHHESYIDWKTFEENQSMITSNYLKLGADEAAGAVRRGQGLLCGIVRCGHCGRKMHVRYWGKHGTSARYVCKGDFESGGAYCIAFGASLVDRRFGMELLKVISPYGIAAGIQASQMLASKDDEAGKLLGQKLQQLEYEEKRAFEQYNEVDPRHRLVAQELERRWNAKLDEVSQVKQQLTEVDRTRQSLTGDGEKTLLRLGEQFPKVWEQIDNVTKKKIIRIVVEEVVVTFSTQTRELTFVIHWKGGCHTGFSMPKPVSSKEHKTSHDDLEIIRMMATRHGDAQTARVLNKLGRSTGKGNRWNETRVKSARLRNSIHIDKEAKNNPDILTLGQAAKYCRTGHKIIEKLVAGGVLKKEQIVAFAPWEIKRSDLDSQRVQKIIKHLHKTGKLVINDGSMPEQVSLFGKSEEPDA